MRFSLRLGSLVLSAVAFLGLQTSQAIAQGLATGEYKIGFITENTGPIAQAGQSFWAGAQLAAEEVKSTKYLGGSSILLEPKEAGSDAARSIQAMSQFIADRSIIATTCCILSPVAGALKPAVLSAKIPLVIYGATAAGLPELPWVYSVTILPGPKDTAAALKVSDALKPKSVVYILAADNDAFKGRMAATQKAMEAKGIATAGVVSVLTKDTDFTAAATQAMGLKPDMILVYTTQQAAAGSISALRDRGFTKTIVGNDVLSPDSIFKKMGPTVVGVPFPVSFSDTISDSPEAKAFVAAYQAKVHAAPDIYSAQGYQMVWLIAQGLKSITGTPTRETLGAALEKIEKFDHQVYGGEFMKEGQAQTTGTIVVNWTAEGKLVPWTPPK